MSITGLLSLFGNKEKKLSLVGKDVLAYCGRCKMNLMHTVVSVASDSKPDRVLCRTCKSERSFKPPKADGRVGSKTGSKGGGPGMADEEIDLDQIDVSRVFLGEEGAKKKPKAKAKAKAKKTKDDSDSRSSSKPSAIPLSMQQANADDILQFENKFNAMKNNLALAKGYKASERFNQGDMIDHKSFGIGFVVAENGLNKIEVLFREGRKLLVTAPK